MFAEFVRSGGLSPDDVVYDAETHEWSSALTHPVVLEIESEAEEGEVPSGAAAAEGDDGADGGGDDVGENEVAGSAPPSADIGLELAPAQDVLSPEAAAAAFVRKMEAERASELDFDEEPGIQGFKVDQSSSGLVDEFGLVPEAEPARTPRNGPPAEPRRVSPRVEESRSRLGVPPKQRRKKGSGALRRYAPTVLVGAVVLGAGAYFGLELFAPSTGEGTELAQDSVELPPPPRPSLPDTEDALRERAQERFLTTTRALLSDVPAIPDIWLDGQYLAAPSDYPEVRDAWVGMLTLVRQVRAGDNERYRAGYSRALEDALVDGSARTLRLAGAVGDFQGRMAPRAAHYDRAEALAMAAIRGHDALVEAEGTIAYEPAAGTPVSGDPVIQAVGRNSDAQALLEEILDMILAELDEPNGPGSAVNLGEWIWEGILGAVTS
jgi:hypothetical protein